MKHTTEKNEYNQTLLKKHKYIYTLCKKKWNLGSNKFPTNKKYLAHFPITFSLTIYIWPCLNTLLDNSVNSAILLHNMYRFFLDTL